MFGTIQSYFRLRYGRDKAYYRMLKTIFGLRPNNIELYKLALIHRSASLFLDDGAPINNERLEFLGDAVIESPRAATALPRNTCTGIRSKR